MRCEQCKKIMLGEIPTPIEYISNVEDLCRMVSKGELEIAFESVPINKIFGEDGRFSRGKMFHQFKCTKCGTVYGLLVNTRSGGELKINEKVFDPDDYPDSKPQKPKEE